jgi:hypothetical protein
MEAIITRVILWCLKVIGTCGNRFHGGKQVADRLKNFTHDFASTKEK